MYHHLQIESFKGLEAFKQTKNSLEWWMNVADTRKNISMVMQKSKMGMTCMKNVKGVQIIFHLTIW
jgi:hypothetical protein